MLASLGDVLRSLLSAHPDGKNRSRVTTSLPISAMGIWRTRFPGFAKYAVEFQFKTYMSQQSPRSLIVGRSSSIVAPVDLVNAVITILVRVSTSAPRDPCTGG